MEVKLREDESELLQNILIAHLSDLRMEIRGTDDRALRHALKQDEETIRGLLGRLRQQFAAAA